MKPSLLLPILCVLLAASLGAPVPVLDEESYLAITEHFDALRPYNWWRPWPPWFGGSEPDAFVYAHPPLFLEWVAAWRDLSADPRVVRGLCGLPMAALLGWSAGRLIERMTHRRSLSIALWLSSPVVLLGLQRGLMPDLMVAALGTTAVMGWRESHEDGPRRLAWSVLGGLALGCAAWTKYPALALVPALLIHARWVGRLRTSWPFWLAAAAPWLAGELGLWLVYGRVHLVEVLTRAAEISRGTGPGRALGLLVRLPLGLAVVGLSVRGLRWLWAPSVGLGLGVWLWGYPMQVASTQRLWLLGWAVAGAAVVVLALFSLRRGQVQADGDRVLLALVALSVLGGVWAVHNFAAPRYMLMAILPLILLLEREVGLRPGGRRLLWGGIGLQLLCAITLTVSEHRFFVSAARLADAVHARVPGGGFYTGEWSFRWAMDQHGWTFFTGDAPTGSVVAVPANSSPGAIPTDWERLDTLRSPPTDGVAVVHDTLQIGLYAETLGVHPVGWLTGSVEEVTLWRVP